MNILNEIKRNSNIPEKIINEESTSADVATTQDFLSALIDEKYNDSLAYNIAEVQPLESSFGSVYASMRNYQTNNFEVVRKDINTKLYTIKTGYTIEVWQDMMKLFKSRAIKNAGKILSGLSAQDENFEIMDLLAAESLTKDPLEININNSAWITSQISMKVAESVIEMNRYGFKTLNSFCILSPRWAAAFLGTASYVKSDEDSNNKDMSLFIGRYGRTDFYVNPFRNDRNSFFRDFDNDFGNDTNPDNGPDYAYVGLKSDTPGESSLTFAPYQYELNSVADPDTYEQLLFLYNRYGLVTNPLHEPIEGKSMLHKFILSEAP